MKKIVAIIVVMCIFGLSSIASANRLVQDQGTTTIHSVDNNGVKVWSKNFPKGTDFAMAYGYLYAMNWPFVVAYDTNLDPAFQYMLDTSKMAFGNNWIRAPGR